MSKKISLISKFHLRLFATKLQTNDTAVTIIHTGSMTTLSYQVVMWTHDVQNVCYTKKWNQRQTFVSRFLPTWYTTQQILMLKAQQRGLIRFEIERGSLFHLKILMSLHHGGAVCAKLLLELTGISEIVQIIILANLE